MDHERDLTDDELDAMTQPHRDSAEARRAKADEFVLDKGTTCRSCGRTTRLHGIGQHHCPNCGALLGVG